MSKPALALDSEQKPRVLVVEDTTIQAKKLVFYLNRFGYETDWAENGMLGLEKLRSGHFDLVMTDIQMPEMDGLEMLERIKSDSELNRIPVIVLTTLNEEDVCFRALELGANDFLPKPFKPEEVQLRADNLIKLYRFEQLLRSENYQLSSELMVKNQKLKLHLEELETTHTQLKETQSQLLQTQKMASLGTLSAGIAHEINNPLAIIKAYNEEILNIAKEDGDQKDQISYLSTVMATAIDRITGIIQHLRSFAKKTDDDKPKEKVCINQTIKSLQDFFGEMVKVRSVKVTHRLSSKDPVILGFQSLVEYAILNIIQNAIHAVEESETKEVLISSECDEENKKVYIFIEDTGCGIPQDKIGQIFDPFYSTKDPGKGMGLGLSLVATYVEKLGGEISVTSSPSGTKFCLTFNLADKDN